MAAAAPSLYEGVLGARFMLLPAEVQRLHRPASWACAAGRCTVERGGGLLARLIGALMSFPPTGEVALRFAIEVKAGRELWRRDFGGAALTSELWEERGELRERMGLCTFRHALDADGSGLRMRVLAVRAFGIPLPPALWPRVSTFEHGRNGRYFFEVSAGLPLIGRIVRYAGWLELS
jgi:hypothetical protein